MAITYPLDLPSHTGIARIEMFMVNAVATSRSPFTFSTQVQAYQGQMWQADVTLPPMKLADARIWAAWMTSLRGQYGTFLMGDPLGATPQGVGGGTPLVNGASQTGGSLTIDGAPSSISNWLKAGDYIQLGAGSTATLHQVLQDVTTTSGGGATLDLWPHVRTAPADNAAVTITNPVGRFRLATNQQSFSINEASIYGITFSAMEAI